MEKYFLMIVLALSFSSCRKARVGGQLVGTWDATYYKIDGVEQDISYGILLYFDGNEGGTFKNEDTTGNGGSYFNADFFKHVYSPDDKKLILYYSSGLKEELTIDKMKVLPNGLSYADEETAKEEYMILSKDKEEWKFVKRFEE